MRRYTLVRQHDSADCAVAALSMICIYYGKDVTLAKMREACGTGIGGTNIEGLSIGAKKMGFDIKAVRVSNEEFLKGDFTMPAICHTVVNGHPHYVVLTKMKKGRVSILDPASGKRKLNTDDFFEEFDNILILLKPNGGFISSKITGASFFSRVRPLLMVQKKLFITAIAAGLILTVAGIVSSFFNRILIDEILPYGLKDQLVILCAIFLGIALLNVAISAVRQHVVLYLSQKISIPVMIGYYNHIFRLPMTFFGSRKTGDIITRFQDAGTIISVASGIIMTVIVDIVFAVISGIVLYTINPTLFGIVLVFTFISIVLVFIFRQPFKKINREQMEAASALNSATIDSLRGINTVKANAAEDHIMEKIENRFVDNLRIGFGANVLSNYQGTTSGVISAFSSIFMMWMGAMFVIDGNITLGTLMAFSTLSGFFTSPVSRLVGLQFQLQEADIAMKRLDELFDIEEEDKLFRGSAIPDSMYGDIEVKNADFRYGTGSPILTDINMTIKAGTAVAIVGESGSGKTTLCNMILGLLVPGKGEISVNGYELSELDILEYRRRVAYVQQNVELFSGTVTENILIGDPSASDPDIRKACKAAGCSDFINKMPMGYGTYLEEAGANLSGGERQRLALARALVKEPEILILDEATSGLDFIAEKRIYDSLFNDRSKRTTVIVAHRLSTIRRCDMIFVMSNGTIAESGMHQELLERRGTYWELWSSQMGNGTEIQEQTIASDTPRDGADDTDEIEYTHTDLN